ncbi:hypothetical protein ONZ43_g5184 [Nemania bipapillata]|uniref:Uncharacterized protein n=1 Tax=Nemania bipapillata TaxID=110536 RepID=A0ACC2IDM5_9PEZI|nr:hypothetical protein ONZ43_g5184 [Nemania bipapillata]
MQVLGIESAPPLELSISSGSKIEPDNGTSAFQAGHLKDAINTGLSPEVKDMVNGKSQLKSKCNQEDAIGGEMIIRDYQKSPWKQLDSDTDSSSSDTDDSMFIPLPAATGNQMASPLLQMRRQNADRKLKQAKSYARLIEARIQKLEQDVWGLGNSNQEFRWSKDQNNPIGLQEYPKRIRLSVAVLGWTEFNRRILINRKDTPGKWRHRPELGDDPGHAIEVLTEEPCYGISLPKLGKQDLNELQSRSIHTDLAVSYAEPYQIRIRSPSLLDFLKGITGCDVTIGRYKHRLLLIRPFKLLVRFAQDIRNHIVKIEEGRRNVETDKYLGRAVELQQGVNPDVTKIAFNELWYIFKPGYEIRSPGESQIQIYRIIKVTGGRDSLTVRVPPEFRHTAKPSNETVSEGSFVIECFYINFDGTNFGPVKTTFKIPKFDDERDIKMLPVIPLQCYTTEAEIHEKLLRRGEKFIELSNPTTRVHRKYKGLTLDRSTEQVDSEVIIDFELAFIQTKFDKPVFGVQELTSDNLREFMFTPTKDHICPEPGCCGNDITFVDYQIDEMERASFKNRHRYLFDNLEHRAQLKPEHMILLPPYVYGFILRTRRWATFDINRLEEIPRSEEGWNNLVIKDYIKNTVLALVKNHELAQGRQEITRGALSSVDLVQGKGRGLIMLLHGEPGVGKTSTAECVAALTGRPLFPITCGDIGDKAETVETNLEKNFQLAHKWGCVLLLDEADIFLSARTVDDIQRNAIVSGKSTMTKIKPVANEHLAVFLRTLEYYSGILFLTTNRVGKIDRAFKSRIHIWKNNIQRVEGEFATEGKKIRCKKDEIIEFAKEHYEELKRQIRNAFQTAIAIAIYNSKQTSSNDNGDIPILDASQFKMVARSAKQFDKYLKEASAHTDADFAKFARERDDQYPSSSEDEEKDSKKLSRKRRKSSKKRKWRGRDRSDDDSEGSGSQKSTDEESEDIDSTSDGDDGESRRQKKKKKRV